MSVNAMSRTFLPCLLYSLIIPLFGDHAVSGPQYSDHNFVSFHYFNVFIPLFHVSENKAKFSGLKPFLL